MHVVLFWLPQKVIFQVALVFKRELKIMNKFILISFKRGVFLNHFELHSNLLANEHFRYIHIDILK